MLDSYQTRMTKALNEQIEAMNESISRLEKEKDRLLRAQDLSNQGMIVCPFESTYLVAVFIGETVTTKYGEEVRVVAVDGDNGKLTIEKEDGLQEVIGGDRLS